MNVEAMQDILDIEGIVHFPWAKIWALLAFFGGALILLALLVLILRWRAKRKGRGDPDELLPPHKRAFLELDRLDRKGLLEKGEFRKYVFFLSEIFRRYLEERYAYPALEKTTNEMAPDFTRKMGFSKPLSELAEGFFRRTDLIKFARFQPSVDEVAGERGKVVELIRATMVVEEKKSEAA